MHRGPSEGLIQTGILEYLTIRGIFAWRAQATPIPIRRGNQIVGLRKVPENLKGMPDIMVLHKGVFIGIEVKRDDGKQSKEQKVWEAQIIAAGGRYIIARTILDAVAAMQKIPL